MFKREIGLRSGGAFNWFFQRVTGAVLLITLLIHFWALHFFGTPTGEITYESVMQRLQHPLWRGIDMLFLVAALFHAMNGLTLLANDYVRAKGWRIAIIGSLWVAAIFYLIVGSLTILGLPGGNI
ncbi:MAG: succinate dehydrogenase, hydrophobic membrane anchor protein [Calditrichaeota bacterium]|nr:succinate dehydrogenase, hydrophobic membrane anchor protein [Calditrichota bacterium]